MIQSLALALALALASTATAASPAPTPPKPPPTQTAGCDSPQSHQFDFWVGHWTATNNGDGSAAGENLVEKLYKGCAIRENWSEPGLVGGSLSAYSPADHQWRQVWTDSSGGWRTFAGGMVDGHMVLIWSHPSVRAPGKTAQERVTFTANPDDTVRQHGELSPDGTAWVEGYDITYHRVGKR